MAQRQKSPPVSTAEIEALRRRFDRIKSDGSVVPDAAVEKYQRLELIAGNRDLGAEASALATELFVFFESEKPRRKSKASGEDQVQFRLEPHMLAALDGFVAEHDRFANRTEAISEILHDALKDRGFLPIEARKANQPEGVPRTNG